MAPLILAGLMLLALVPAQLAQAGEPAGPCEISADGRQLARETEWLGIEASGARSDEVPCATVPDWQNSLRMQVGGLRGADMNSDGLMDVVVGCYRSNSYPPYPDGYNMIDFNDGGAAMSPSVSTAIAFGDTNGDQWLDLVAPLTAGRHELRGDGRDGAGRRLESGVYLCRLRAGKQVESIELS